MTKRLDLDALDLVSGGMDIRSLHAHVGAGGATGHVGSLPGVGGAPGVGGIGGGPGFAPILPGHDPMAQGYDGALGVHNSGPQYGAPQYGGIHAPGPGMDPYGQGPYGMGPGAMVQQPEHHSFSNDLQQIASIANAFVGIIGAFTGHAPSTGSTAPDRGNGRMVSREPDDQNDQGLGNGSVGNDDQLDGPSGGDMIDASTQGGHTVDTGAVAENDGTGGHTNFHETDDGFVRG